MNGHHNLPALDRFKMRIQGLRAKTIDNGCTEAEAAGGAPRWPSCSIDTTCR